MTLAERLNDWLMVTFSARKLCWVYFYFIESGPDLKNPVLKMEPYIAWVHPESHIKHVSEMFRTKVKKGRNIQLKDIQIIPVGRVTVI